MKGFKEWIKMDNNLMFLSIGIVAVIAGAIIIPFAAGNLNLNYQQPTPIVFNTTNTGREDMTSHLSDTVKTTTTVQPEHIISFGVLGFDFGSIAHEAELIVIGKVLDVKQGGMVGVSTAGVPDSLTHFPSINNLVQIDKVIKGQYIDKTINVVTEGDLSGKTKIEDSVQMHKGERTVLFLHKEPTYKNQWTVVGMNQGKFNVDAKGTVLGKLAAADIKASLLGLEANLKQVLSKPLANAKSVDNTRDLTTAEAQAAEDADRQEIANQAQQAHNNANEIKNNIDAERSNGFNPNEPRINGQEQPPLEPQDLQTNQNNTTG